MSSGDTQTRRTKHVGDRGETSVGHDEDRTIVSDGLNVYMSSRPGRARQTDKQTDRQTETYGEWFGGAGAGVHPKS